MKRTFHFCIQSQEISSQIEFYDGILTTEILPDDKEFYSIVKKAIIESSQKKLSLNNCVFLSLSLLYESP